MVRKESLKEITLEEYKKGYRAMIASEEKQGFQMHLAAYILVNLILILTNLIYSRQAVWFIYPLLGWGIGLTAHYLYSVKWVENELLKKEGQAEAWARKLKRR